MIDLSLPRTWIGVSAALLLGLTAGCRHCDKPDCDSCPKGRCKTETCVGNVCPPYCYDECNDDGWLGRLLDKRKKCNGCGQPHCQSCPKGGCNTCAPTHCGRCGKPACKSRKNSCGVCGQPHCTGCVQAGPSPYATVDAQPKVHVVSPIPVPKPSVRSSEVVIPMGPMSNERYRAPLPVKETSVPKPVLESLPALPVPQPAPPIEAPSTLPTRPESDKPTLPPVGIKPVANDKADGLVDHTTDRRSFADITARPEFAHASDYRWLVGELQYVSGREKWRLRFASIDEEDRYGGSVTLEGAEHMLGNFSAGMIVRVEGSIIDPDTTVPSPRYRVKSVESVKK